MVEIEVLMDKLNEMTDPEEIRLFFASRGVKGFMQRADRCPIAAWLKAESGHEVVVEDSVVDMTAERVWDRNEMEQPEYVLGSGPAQFIKKFDLGEYRELIIPSSFGSDFCIDDDLLDQDYDVQS